MASGQSPPNNHPLDNHPHTKHMFYGMGGWGLARHMGVTVQVVIVLGSESPGGNCLEGDCPGGECPGCDCPRTMIYIT